jgi:Zn-dependent protease
VLLEIEKLQNSKGSWSGAVMLLVISLVLFFGAGAKQWSLKYVMILIPVLLVHELGHYLAMRAFNYRNLRMFFIPFFGAAVSGRHFNVQGWKKVVVSLMGPVPGILLGILIGCAGLILHNALMTKIGIVALVLNGYNLIPLLPLDGGWVVYNLLFSRNPLVDAGFRIVAAIGLAVLGIFSKSKLLMYLAIPMLIGIPAAYRTAKISTKLRQSGLPAAAPDDQNIPPETASAIINEVKLSTPGKPQSNKMVAQQSLQIFETLNTHPPGWPATIGLLFSHVISFGLAVVFAITFIVIQNRSVLGNFLDTLSSLPTNKIECGTSLTWNPHPSDNSTTNLAEGFAPSTVVATLKTHDEALALFQKTTNLVASSTTVQLLGETVMVHFRDEPRGARNKLFENFQGQTTNLFVANSNLPAAMTLSFVAPSAAEATNIANELNGYFNTLPGQHLIPPWLPGDSRTHQEIEHDLFERRSYELLQRAEYKVFTNPEINGMNTKYSIIQRRGDVEELKTWRNDLAEAQKRLRRQNLETALMDKNNPIDPALAKIFLDLEFDSTVTNRPNDPRSRSMAKLMGQLPQTGDTTTFMNDIYTAKSGYVTQLSVRVSLRYATFESICDGAPALMDWLCTKGCKGITYEIETGDNVTDPDEKEN